jgi:rod shape-determining protein MreC
MESFYVRYKNALVLIAVLLAQTILLAVQVRDLRGPSEPDGRKVTLLRSWAVDLAAPFERASTYIGKGIRGSWANYVDLRHTRQQNADLQKEIARLRLEQAEFAEDAMQGRRLQSLLAFQQQYVTTTVAAQVIGTSGVDQARLLIIDKGTDFGLKPDMAVITPDGIVGKLRDVFPHTAQVLLINDPSSGAGVILASTRIRAIVRGGPDGRVQIGNLTADSRIKPGEVVLTSGGDQVFPRGLKVGTIESISQDHDRQIYTLIRVQPAANLSQLEEVLIITGTQPNLPPEAQQDLALGEATAIDAKRAAEVAAERLPSLNPAPAEGTVPNADGTVPPAQPAIDPKNPGGPIPKPIPTLHPDRYSYGETPPASSLTPGGANGGASPSDPATDPSGSGSTGTPAPRLPRPKKPATPDADRAAPDSAAKPTSAPKEPRR